MTHFQENAWTEGRMEGQKDRPYFIGTLQLPLGVQKYLKCHFYKVNQLR